MNINYTRCLDCDHWIIVFVSKSLPAVISLTLRPPSTSLMTGKKVRTSFFLSWEALEKEIIYRHFAESEKSGSSISWWCFRVLRLLFCYRNFLRLVNERHHDHRHSKLSANPFLIIIITIQCKTRLMGWYNYHRLLLLPLPVPSTVVVVVGQLSFLTVFRLIGKTVRIGGGRLR